MSSIHQFSPFDYQVLYDRLWENGYHASHDYSSHIRTYASWIKRKIKYESLLDVGCGSGGSLELFKRRNQISTGVDISRVAVGQGQRLGRNVVHASATKLPFEDDSFDLVISADVFEHLHPADIELAVRESVRVAKNSIFMKISTRVDRIQKWKEIAGHSLHLTIQPINWWIEQFSYAGNVVWHDDHAFCIKQDKGVGHSC